ncbi:MAG: hypothetical protein U5K51_03820 [Flavobacteriaceae bacterium]|nr:hypothetical protein [Flavobacteriaceae bacterium]
MKIKIILIALTTMFSCNLKQEETEQKQEKFSVAGSWKLLSGTLIEKGDTVVTDYTKNISFIKIINDSHLLFCSMT